MINKKKAKKIIIVNCSIFSCDKNHSNQCCATCLDKHKCRNHCLNSPDKCRCATGDTQPKESIPNC